MRNCFNTLILAYSDLYFRNKLHSYNPDSMLANDRPKHNIILSGYTVHTVYITFDLKA